MTPLRVHVSLLMKSAWFTAIGALCAAFVFIVSASTAAAQSACIYSCTNGSSTQALVADCGTCKATCFAGCAGTTGAKPAAGCYAWRCGTQSEQPNGDNCPVNLLNQTLPANMGDTAAAIQDRASTRQVPTGMFSCRTPLDAADQGQNCLSQSVCGGGRQCCVPNDRRTCAQVLEATAAPGSLTSVRDELTRIERSTNTNRSQFYCQNPPRDSANHRCYNLATPNGCPGQAGAKCCAPEDAIGGLACGTAAGGAVASQVTQLQDRSRTQANEWYCQLALASKGINASEHCLATNTLCRGQYKCCVTPEARTAMGSSAGLPPTTSCVERAARMGNRGDVEGAADLILQQAKQAAGNPAGFDAQYTRATGFECLRACIPADTQRFCVGGGNGCDGAGVQCCLTTAFSRLQVATPQNVCPAGTTGGSTTGGAGTGGAGTGAPSAGGRAGESSPGVTGRLVLPSCIQSGNCELSDILRTGASFANFIFELSGAIFLLMFVVGGIMYLLAGVDSSYPKKGKEFIVTSAIGMIIIFGAAAIVRYVYGTLTQRADPTESTCERQFAAEGFRCSYVPGTTAQEIAQSVDQMGCKSELNLCNLDGQDRNIRCCPTYGSGEPTGTRPPATR